MLSSLIKTIEEGYRVMISNSRMFLVGVLVFVLPIMFLSVTNSFRDVASDNIETIRKQYVGNLQDSLEILLTKNTTNNTISEYIDAIIKNDSTINKIRIVKKEAGDYRIVFSNNKELIDTYEQSSDVFNTLPLTVGEGSVIIPVSIDGRVVWQVFRSVQTNNQQLIIFSEHSLSKTDNLLASRQVDSYLGLTAIFIFLIALAYWLNRQVFWQGEATALQAHLKEHDLFSNMIAHEFRTPLTAIKGYASLLKEDKSLNEEQGRFVENIRTSSERLVLLVNDFLEVSRIQSGKLTMKDEQVDIQKVLARVVEDLTPLAQEKNLELLFAPKATPIICNTDSDRLIQVMTNIITNSIKYTDKGEVEIVATDDRSGVTIRIQDTGSGISAEDQQKLFAPFTRVGNADQSAVTGTGLGMWITKQLTTLLGGTIGVESIKGVGTHVVINFKDW